jgi:hypothetical protein
MFRGKKTCRDNARVMYRLFESPIDPSPAEILLEFFTRGKELIIRRIKIFAFISLVAMFPAYSRTGIVYQAPVVAGKVLAGGPEFEMPVPFMIDKYIHIFMREVPADIVIIGF